MKPQCVHPGCVRHQMLRRYCLRHAREHPPPPALPEQERIARELTRLRGERDQLHRAAEIARFQCETARLTTPQFGVGGEGKRLTTFEEEVERLAQTCRNADRIVGEIEQAVLDRYGSLPEPPPVLPRKHDPEYRKAYFQLWYAKNADQHKQKVTERYREHQAEANAKNLARYHRLRRQSPVDAEYAKA